MWSDEDVQFCSRHPHEVQPIEYSLKLPICPQNYGILQQGYGERKDAARHGELNDAKPKGRTDELEVSYPKSTTALSK